MKRFLVRTALGETDLRVTSAAENVHWGLRLHQLIAAQIRRHINASQSSVSDRSPHKLQGGRCVYTTEGD